MNVITFQKLNDILNLRGLETIFQISKTFKDLKTKGSHLFKVQLFKPN
jgi:hypothetical protein